MFIYNLVASFYFIVVSTVTFSGTFILLPEQKGLSPPHPNMGVVYIWYSIFFSDFLTTSV